MAGGNVEVTLGTDDSSPGSPIVLLAQGNGRGIAPERRARAWERFYRVPGTSEADTGIGLAIAQRVVQRMGGTWALPTGWAGAAWACAAFCRARGVARHGSTGKTE